MKLQVIYVFYIADDNCDNKIYQMHYYWINKISSYVDKFKFIVLYNNNIDDDIIFRIKGKLLSICESKTVELIFEKNNSKFREGLYFKKYIIDNLNKYDDYLTFFAHTKGVSNPVGIENIDNLLLWIDALYYFNFWWVNEMQTKLAFNTDYIIYGSLYFKDYRHTNTYHWFFSGSFYWLNTKKFNDYINANNINVNNYLNIENENLRRCAELFIGNCLPIKYVAFHNDENFNKEYELFYEHGWEISYKFIGKLIEAYLNVAEVNFFYVDHKKIIDDINNV